MGFGYPEVLRDNNTYDLTGAFSLMRIAAQPNFRTDIKLQSKILKATGSDFLYVMERLRKDGNDIALMKPYSDEILKRFGNFIGYKTNRLPFEPLDDIEFFQFTDDDPRKDIPLLYNHENNVISINVDNESKSEAFVFAAILRYVYENKVLENGNRKIKHGFFNLEFKPNNFCIKCENKFLYEGLIRLLTADVIKSVTGDEPELVTHPTKECAKPKELMKVAGLLRDYANTNEMENMADTKYDPQKDALIYDFFVNKEIKSTKREINFKNEEIKYDYVRNAIETMALKYGEEFDRQYSQLVDVLMFLNEEKKN